MIDVSAAVDATNEALQILGWDDYKAVESWHVDWGVDLIKAEEEEPCCGFSLAEKKVRTFSKTIQLPAYRVWEMAYDSGGWDHPGDWYDKDVCTAVNVAQAIEMLMGVIIAEKLSGIRLCSREEQQLYG